MNSSISRRTGVVFFGFVLLYSLIIANLYFIQIIHGSYYVQLGERQYLVSITRFPQRAEITDRNGNPLALNKDSLTAFIIPSKISDPAAIKQFLKQHFSDAYERLQIKPHTQFMYIKRKLTPEEIMLIEQSNLSDIKFLQEPSRFYPNPATANIIGTVDAENNGLLGIEFQYNTQLSGTPTHYRLERDARSGHFYFNKEIQSNGNDGKPIRLTIDGNLQFLVQEELQETLKEFNAKAAAAVIMDPANGHIIAMANVPTFDPNNLYNLVIEHTKNIAITDAYELGSVIKVLSAIAALEEGIVHPYEIIDCKNSKTAVIDGRTINTVPSSVRGMIPFTQVIALSNNIGIAQVAKRLGTKLYDHYQKMGLGKKTGINMFGENSGYINPPPTWSKQSIISLSYGYEVTVTLIQLARIFAMIANNGFECIPRIIFDDIEPAINKHLYSSQTMQVIQEILEQTTIAGTAKRAAIKGYRIICKTGTANMLENGKYNPDKNLFSCAGIVQKNNYKRVVVVLVKEANSKNLYASTVAVPLFERIAEKVLIQDQIV
ncbi:MAG: peptidoglycan D,D-transpeptidase FtsI family protein [Candidatus Dependentiae bacterium]